MRRIEADSTEVVSKTLAQTPPPTHAGGQDDGSYTNSLKIGRYRKETQEVWLIPAHMRSPSYIKLIFMVVLVKNHFFKDPN